MAPLIRPASLYICMNDHARPVLLYLRIMLLQLTLCLSIVALVMPIVYFRLFLSWRKAYKSRAIQPARDPVHILCPVLVVIIFSLVRTALSIAFMLRSSTIFSRVNHCFLILQLGFDSWLGVSGMSNTQSSTNVSIAVRELGAYATARWSFRRGTTPYYS